MFVATAKYDLLFLLLDLHFGPLGERGNPRSVYLTSLSPSPLICRGCNGCPQRATRHPKSTCTIVAYTRFPSRPYRVAPNRGGQRGRHLLRLVCCLLWMPPPAPPLCSSGEAPRMLASSYHNNTLHAAQICARHYRNKRIGFNWGLFTFTRVPTLAVGPIWHVRRVRTIFVYRHDVPLGDGLPTLPAYVSMLGHLTDGPL